MSMGMHTHKALRCIAASRAGRIAIAAVSVAIWTKGDRARPRGRHRRPFSSKLERITEFFNNEVATGEVAGRRRIDPAARRPVYLKNFGVQDVETKVPMLVQTQNERGRILPAFRKLVYDAFATGK